MKPLRERMHEALGPGACNAMRGHGGIGAQVVVPGIIRPGDTVGLPPNRAGVRT